MAEDWILATDEAPDIGEVLELLVRSEHLYGIDLDGDLVTFPSSEWPGGWIRVAVGFPLAAPILTTFQDNIYSIANQGHLMNWNGVDGWTERTSTNIAGGLFRAMVHYDGVIFAGEEILYKYVWAGSQNNFNEPVAVTGPAPGSADGRITKMITYEQKIYMTTEMGELYRWNEVDAWVLAAPTLGLASPVSGLLVFDDNIYCLYQNTGRLLKWNGVNAWVQMSIDVSTPASGSLATFQGSIYRGGMSPDGADLSKFNPLTQLFEQVQNDSTDLVSILSLRIFNEKLFASGT